MCLEEGERTIHIECGHVFHASCIKSWLRVVNTIPVDWRLSRDRLASGTRFVQEGPGFLFVYSKNSCHKESRWLLDDTHPGVSQQWEIVKRALLR